jgi:hypothetical protein
MNTGFGADRLAEISPVPPETSVLDSNARNPRHSLRRVLANSASRLRFAMFFGTALALWIALFLILPTDLRFDDDVNSYLGGAAALSAGHGYRFEQYINLPPVRRYPPGYSIWLSIFWKNGQPISRNSDRLEIANWLAAGAALVGLACCLFISELPTWLGWTLLISFGTSVLFTQLTVWLMSDVLFTAGTCGLALFVATYDSERSGRQLAVWWFCASLLIGGLCVLRVAALAFAAGLGAFGLWNGDLRRPLRLACFVVPVSVALWFVQATTLPAFATPLNVAQFGGLLYYALRSTAIAILYGSQRWLLTVFLSAPDRLPYSHAFQHAYALTESLAFILGLAVFALPVFLGMRRGPRQQKDRIALFIIGVYMLELVFWSHYDGGRLGMPIVPFVLTFLARGLTSKASRIAFLTVLAVNIPGNAWLSYKILRSQEEESVQSLAELRQAASWINASAGPTSRVAAGRLVPLTHLYEYLGRRMFANAGPNELSTSLDVNPAAQGNMRAEYVVASATLESPGQHYQIKRRFGHWMVMAPN